MKKKTIKVDKKRELKRDVVVSITSRGQLVGVYYADTDGSSVVAEMTPQSADNFIKKHNKGIHNEKK